MTLMTLKNPEKLKALMQDCDDHISPDANFSECTFDDERTDAEIDFDERIELSYVAVDGPEDEQALYKFPTTYSINLKGKKLYWWMELLGDQHRSISKTGEDGKEKVTGWTTCKPKNIGKANETTPMTQADAEVRATYAKKLKNHWHLNEDDYMFRHYIEPTLAQKYEGPDDKLWLTYDSVITQPKLDGFRCIITKDGAFSRKGEEFTSIPHITKSMEELFEACPEAILDGELYNHELRDDFNELSSIIRKKKPSEEDLDKSEKLIKFYMYDLPSDSEFDYLERYESINLLLSKYFSPYVEIVETNVVNTHKQVRDQLEGYLQRGYEGLMVRLDKDHLNEDRYRAAKATDRTDYQGYEMGRRGPSLKKFKLFVDEEFELLNITEGLGSWSGRAKSLTFRLEDGTTCDGGIKGDFAFASKLLKEKDKHIGRLVTIKYFERTPDNKPRFGVAIKFH